ncbi:hypothetical protein [Peribacillus kribbensis]|uniref:hypothetical protein n=1 Tax=Peribacillus kribbensis TaxID=356658 RepID=UPI000425E0A5|nr:hypothetical protein [Peribacillus kribbensis]
MTNDLNDPDFSKYCEKADPEDLMLNLTGGNIRGLDRLAMRSLSQRKQLPLAVVNVLLVYFFTTFSNKVYDRNDLARVYDHWAKNQVYTFTQAKHAATVDIHTILKRTR